MDSAFIVPRLLRISELLYGKDSKPFAKEKQGVYIFGAKEFKPVLGKGKHGEKQVAKNTVTKAIAIFIILNKLPDEDIKKQKNKKRRKGKK